MNDLDLFISWPRDGQEALLNGKSKLQNVYTMIHFEGRLATFKNMYL